MKNPNYVPMNEEQLKMQYNTQESWIRHRGYTLENYQIFYRDSGYTKAQVKKIWIADINELMNLQLELYHRFGVLTQFEI